MNTANRIVSVLWVGFLLGCATGQSVQKEPEKITVQSESPEKHEAKYDALLERLKTLEQSVSILRSEVASMGYRLNSGQPRRSLTAYKLPKEVSLCEERFPLEDRNVWENLDREFLVALSNEVQDRKSVV
jgi:hypothetical protein